MIGIVGSLDTSTYTDDTGIKRKRVVVIAENISFCESKAKETAAPAAGAQPNEPPADEFPDFEEIPDFDDMNSYTEQTV